MAAVILTATVLISHSRAEGRQEIVIFHAGSLKVPLAEMGKRFEKAYPAYDVVREFGGSTKMARLISDKGFRQSSITPVLRAREFQGIIDI